MYEPTTEWGRLMFNGGIMSSDEIMEAEAKGRGLPPKESVPPISNELRDLIDSHRKGEISANDVRKKLGLKEFGYSGGVKTFAEAALVELFDILVPLAMPWAGTPEEKAQYASGMLAPHARGLQRLLAHIFAIARRDAERIVELRKWLIAIEKEYPEETGMAVRLAIESDDLAGKPD